MTVPKFTEQERRVADVLHHHAEIAMTTTDTQTRYDDFIASTESSLRRRRVTWGIGTAAAAAAVVIALVLGGLPGLSSNEEDPLLPARARTPVQIAADFVNALAAYDAAKAALDVGTSGDNLVIWPGDPSLREGLAWAEAAGFKILPKDCVSDSPSGSMTSVVTCPYDWHFLGSDHLGQPPRRGDFIRVELRGGRIVLATTALDWTWAGLRRDVNGDHPMFPLFVSWLEREHPDDVPAMIVTGEVVSAEYQRPAYTEESIALWAKYVDEWVASQQ